MRISEPSVFCRVRSDPIMEWTFKVIFWGRCFRNVISFTSADSKFSQQAGGLSVIIYTHFKLLGVERTDWTTTPNKCSLNLSHCFDRLNSSIGTETRRFVRTGQKADLDKRYDGQQRAEYSRPKCEKSNGVARCPLPEGFARLTFIIFGIGVVLGLLVCFVIGGFGKSDSGHNNQS